MEGDETPADPKDVESYPLLDQLVTTIHLSRSLHEPASHSVHPVGRLLRRQLRTGP